MSMRKLAALNYPLSGTFDASDESKTRNLIVWLEDQKIRHYEMDKRENLRNIASTSWPDTFATYLHDVGCPLKPTDPTRELVDWLLGLAIRYEYTDGVDKYSKASKESIQKEQNEAPKMVTANPLDNFDFSSPEFVAGVNAIADKLEISKHPNHLVTLEAIITYAKTRMTKQAVETPDADLVKGIPFPFNESDMGFDKGDYVTNQASKVLRLLYIHDLRELQTKINECIVAVQTITANPKTDTKIGLTRLGC